MKTVTLDYKLYKEELADCHHKGYEDAFREVTNFIHCIKKGLTPDQLHTEFELYDNPKLDKLYRIIKETKNLL